MFNSIFKTFGFLTLGLAWLSYDHYRPWTSFHAEALAFAGLGFLAFGRYCATAVITLPKIPLVIAIVAIVPWVQYVVGILLFSGDALMASLYIGGLAVAVCMGYSLATDDDNLSATSKISQLIAPIFQILWLVAIVSAAIGLLQWLSLQEPIGMYVVQTDAGDRARGNLGQPNQLATLLLMGIASLAFSYESKHIGRIGLSVGVLFLTLTLILTQSRASMVSAGVMAIFLISKIHIIKSRLRQTDICIWILIFSVGVIALPYISDLLLMSGSRGLITGTDSERMLIWKQISSAIFQAPFLGYGWNQTTAAQTSGSLVATGDVTYTNAHNFFLDVISWNGIPLGLLIISFCIFWFLSRMYSVKQTDAAYAMSCLLPLSVHSMFEYPYAYAYFLITAGMMVGIVEASYLKSKTIQLYPRWMALGIASCFVVCSYLVYEYLLVEEDFRVVRFENLRIGQTQIDYQVPNVWMLSQMTSMLKAARQNAVPNMSTEDIDNLRKASLRFPYGPISLRYALAMGLNGNPLGASRQLVIIRSMYGERYYQAAVTVLREQQSEKYPQLSQVIAP